MLMGTSKQCNNHSNCKIDPVQLAVWGAFITTIGDFLGFIAALITAQEQCNEKNHNSCGKNYVQARILQLEDEIEQLKKEMEQYNE